MPWSVCCPSLGICISIKQMEDFSAVCSVKNATAHVPVHLSVARAGAPEGSRPSGVPRAAEQTAQELGPAPASGQHPTHQVWRLSEEKVPTQKSGQAWCFLVALLPGTALWQSLLPSSQSGALVSRTEC